MKPLQKSPLTPHERIKRLYYILFGATILVGVANLTYLVMQPDWTIKNVAFCALQYFVVFALLIVPVVLQRKYLINIPLVLIVAIALFAFVAMIMGDGLNFYGIFSWWDSGLHLLSGIVLSFIGLWIVHVIYMEQEMHILGNKWFVSLFIFVFGLALGALWEIMEYSFDDLFLTNTQQFMETTTSSLISSTDVPLVGHEALRDTMTDLTLDFIGSLVVALYVFFNHKKLLAQKREAL